MDAESLDPGPVPPPEPPPRRPPGRTLPAIGAVGSLLPAFALNGGVCERSGASPLSLCSESRTYRLAPLPTPTTWPGVRLTERPARPSADNVFIAMYCDTGDVDVGEDIWVMFSKWPRILNAAMNTAKCSSTTMKYP